MSIDKNKKLYRVQEGKLLGGVCKGLAEYFEIDVTIIRIAWVIVVCFAGVGLLAYLIALLVMPVKPKA